MCSLQDVKFIIAIFKMRGQTFSIFFLLSFLFGGHVCALACNDTIIIKSGIENNKISADWKEALAGRMSLPGIDSLASLQRPVSTEEQDWQHLIASRKEKWNGFKDSLAMPFPTVIMPDTIYILPGYGGADDGFTFGFQTICFDITALLAAYGNASMEENANRLDRIFAHEYTHLLHKAWARDHHLSLPAFRDSILWECLYEGIGMYRSLHPRWMPVNNILPESTRSALEGLYPILSERLRRIEAISNPSAQEKKELNKNLSRGNVNQKWGAFPVAIWLALEAGNDESKLRSWIDMGPSAVLALAKKYLPADL
jgi:hypothetical protein